MAKHSRREPPPSAKEWRESPKNPRNNPKLTAEEAQPIEAEALAFGEIWEVQEEINARRKAERQAEL